MKVRQPFLLLILLASVQGPAHAGLFDDSEARQQIFDMRNELNQRMDKIEAGSRGQLELANQIEQLRAEVARLRGQIEVLMYDVQSVEKRQKDFYVDLDNRLRRLEGGGSTAGATPAAPADPGAEGRDYEAALNLLKEGKNKEAAAAFDAFIRTHPASGFLPSAHYWAGSAALQAKDVNAAINYFNALLNKWPSDTRAPDAMLGLASSQQAMGDAKSSRKTLEDLVARFPSSSAAQMARQRLGKS